MRVFSKHILALTASAALAVALVPGVASASLGGFSLHPAVSNSNDPATRAYFKPSIRQGSSYSSAVIVFNTGKTSLRLFTYAVDGLTGQTTGTVYANRADPVRKAGLWVKLKYSSMILAPGQQRSVPFTVHVPKGAKDGDHVAGIAFENSKPKVSGGKFQITEIIREVIGVEIRVPGKAAPYLALGNASLQSLPGTTYASVLMSLGNKGTALCKPMLAVALSGPNNFHGRVARHLDTVLPGDTITYQLPWSGTLRPGKYIAKTSASCGRQHLSRQDAVALGKVLGNPTAPNKHSASPLPGGIPLWALIGAILLSVLGGLGLGQIRSRKLRERVLAEARQIALEARGEVDPRLSSPESIPIRPDQ